MGDGLCYNTILALKDRLSVLYGDVSESVHFDGLTFGTWILVLWEKKKGSYVFCCFFRTVIASLWFVFFFSFKNT